MADISMCYGHEVEVVDKKIVLVQDGMVCPKRETCRRYTAKAGYIQSYLIGKPMDGSCETYLEEDKHE